MIIRCHDCNWHLPPNLVSCPQCGAEQDLAAARSGAGSESSWLPVARVANLAEIGYLADVLEAESISTQIVHKHDFNAIDGAWRTAYELLVPQPQANSATRMLREELQTSSGDVEWSEEKRSASRGAPLPGWTPVMLVLVAGSLAYCAGRVATVEAVKKPAPVRESLWQAISEDDDPLTTGELNPGSRRLRFEPATGQIVLEDDPDGDGRFRVRRFSNGQLVKESLQ